MILFNEQKYSTNLIKKDRILKFVERLGASTMFEPAFYFNLDTGHLIK